MKAAKRSTRATSATGPKLPLHHFMLLLGRGSFGDKDDPLVKFKCSAAQRFCRQMDRWDKASGGRSMIKVDSSIDVSRNDAFQVSALDHNRLREATRRQLLPRSLQVLDLILIENRSLSEASIVIFGSDDKLLRNRVVDRLDCALADLVTLYRLPSKATSGVPEN